MVCFVHSSCTLQVLLLYWFSTAVYYGCTCLVHALSQGPELDLVVCVSMSVSVCVYVCVCVRVCAYMCVCTYKCMYVYVNRWCVCVFAHVYVCEMMSVCATCVCIPC